MALARVVAFDGVSKERAEEMSREINEGERPDNLPATEMILLHDPDAEQAVAILFFDNEDDYRVGHETLEAMPAGDTPGSRTSVKKYDVALRMTSRPTRIYSSASTSTYQDVPAAGLTASRYVPAPSETDCVCSDPALRATKPPSANRSPFRAQLT
jgi:hypothetical protein